MANSPILILSRADIETCIDMPTAIDLMRQAFLALSTGNAEVPIRSHLHLHQQGSEMLSMPVYMPQIAHSGLKLVGMQPANKERGLPFIQAAVLLMDAESGQLKALMDGSFITALRTGAGSGLATDLLARKEVQQAAIFGTGGQAFHQLEAITSVRAFEKIWVYSRNTANAKSFAKQYADKFTAILEPATDLLHLRGADIICTATSSTKPLFSDSDIAPGTHINGIGSYRPDMAEVPAKLVQKAVIVVDQRKACLHEAGDLIQAIQAGLFKPEEIRAELGEIASGAVPGRTLDRDITFFKSVGNAVQDLAVAHHVYKRACELKLGTWCDW